MPDLLTEQFVNYALGFCGSHYIWGGKGLLQFDLKKGLTPHKFVNEQNKALYVFDCSGLVTHSLFIATGGKLDLRATHSAKMMLDTFPITEADEDGTLFIYPGHVAISMGRRRILDASGGDETTTSIGAAVERNAKVSVHPVNRSGLLGKRRIPVDKKELRAI